MKSNTFSGKNIFKNTSWLFFEKIFIMAINFFVSLWMARYFGPEKFGDYNYALAIVSLFSSFVPLGLIGYLVKELSQNPENEREILGTSFLLRLLGGVLGFIISTIVGLSFIKDDDVFILFMFFNIMLLIQPFEVIYLFFESKIQSKVSVMSRLIGFVISSLIKIILILNNSSLEIFGLVYVSEFIFSLILITFYYNKKVINIKKWNFSKDLSKKYLKSTWPLMLSSLSAIIYLKADQIMLNSMSGSKEVGIYAAAVKLSEVWFFLPTIITSSVFPVLISSRENKSEFEKVLQKNYDFLFGLAFFAAILITLFADLIIKYTYGIEYQDSALVLKIHVWGAIFVFMKALLNRWFIIEEMLKFSAFTHVLGMVINIILNILLIPKYGAIGASIATVISYVFSIYLITFLFKKTRKEGIKMTKSFFIFFRIFRNNY
ncbi:hypothetical protein A3783_00125 [Exiguobacterium undae]|uniref:Flippase n=2 Tax=Exiguobacterium undae TaxID=169177 RepID=A0ABX2V906_9BACL|nr:hypothetical protein A3783_00125 [Exiguobacterium undae]